MAQHTTNNQTLTPLERLRIDKRRVHRLYKRQEAVLNSDVAYIQANAGSLLLSFLSSSLFPSKGNASSAENKNTVKHESELPASSGFSFAGIMPVAKNMIPLVWDIARPIIVSWGIKHAVSTILNSILKKKS